jgi:hypothetical protein
MRLNSYRTRNISILNGIGIMEDRDARHRTTRHRALREPLIQALGTSWRYKKGRVF